jgi:hypothetical protein
VQVATEALSAEAIAADGLVPGQIVAPHGPIEGGDAGDAPRPAGTPADVAAVWAEALKVLSDMAGQRRVVAALKTACQPVGLDGDAFVLGFHPEQSAFYMGQAETSRPVIEEVLGRLLGRPVALRCVTLNAVRDAQTAVPAGKSESFVQRAERGILSVHMERGSR